MLDLLNGSEVPDGFTYPKQLTRMIDLGLTNLEPWWILTGDVLRRRRRAGLVERFPDRDLVPFARRQDNDDVACWEGLGHEVVVVHDFASPGWEQRGRFADVDEWIRHAIEDLIEFGQFE